MRIYISLATLFIFVCSCSTEPQFKTKEYTPRLVIDGSIENNGFPTVFLTYSTSYFSKIDSAALWDLLETTAKVTVASETGQEVLTLKRDYNLFPPFYYKGTSLKGEPGKEYTLTVEVKGKKYTATTSIPDSPKLDRLWFEVVEGKDSSGIVYAKFTDNAAEQNYYRIFSQRLNQDDRFIPVYLSAIGDQYFNGKSFTFSLLRGPENFTEIIDDLYFKKGDVIRVKFCSMDRAHFDFWRTIERELYVVGNPFSSSGNAVISNIKGGEALGVWGGYGVSFYQFTAQ